VHKQKYYAVVFMVLIGIATAWASFNYSIGTLARMGPGYFPLILGVSLIVLAVLLIVTPDSAEEVQADAEREPFLAMMRRRMRVWGAIAGGMIAFIVIGRFGGLVPATFALIFVAALGDPDNSVKASFWLAVGVVTFAVLVFHYGMQLQFPLFSWR